jgi:hypothetical protein
MAFTYSGAPTTDRDRVRFYVHDVTANSGPLPGDANFSDAEIDGLLATEGTWQRSVAAAYETLAAAWRKHPDFTADGLTLRRTAIADGYAEQAKTWRQKYGDAGSSSSGKAGSRAMTRVDGYSQDVDNQEV